jgi:hypothetical protein
MPSPRRQYLIAIAAALAGLALFAYAVRRAGVAEILDGIRRVGWGLTVILAFAGLRFLIRAECWRWCLPPGISFPLARAAAAFLAGDAVGNVTPLGLLASEPTKILLTRHQLATREAVSSLAIENLVYAASVIAMVGVGLVVVAATVPLPRVWLMTIVAALMALSTGTLVVFRAMRGTWDPRRGTRPRWRERLAGVREEVLRFSGGYPRRLWRVFALDLAFHALAVFEVFLTLRWVLGDRSPTLVQAVAFEALNRVITVAFQFVPLRVGVDEASAGALAPLLAINPAAGVTLAVVRKVRNLIWAAIGLILVAAHPAETHAATKATNTL